MSVLIIAIGLAVRLAYWALHARRDAAHPGVDASPARAAGCRRTDMSVDEMSTGIAGASSRCSRRRTQSQTAVMTIGPGEDAGPEEMHAGDQVIYVIEGEAPRAARRGRRTAAGPGACVMIPAGTRHHVEQHRATRRCSSSPCTRPRPTEPTRPKSRRVTRRKDRARHRRRPRHRARHRAAPRRRRGPRGAARPRPSGARPPRGRCGGRGARPRGRRDAGGRGGRARSARVVARWGRLDVLVNNAGITGPLLSHLGAHRRGLAARHRRGPHQRLPLLPRGGAGHAARRAAAASSTSPRSRARRATRRSCPTPRPRRA